MPGKKYGFLTFQELKMDFEVYDERSKDWSDAEVDVYLSIVQ